MSDADEQHGQARSRTLSRVVAFTDAAVAIALTLLVLPLVDLARDARDIPVGTLLNDNGGELFSFVLSFIVINRFWAVHRRGWEGVVDYDEALLTMNSVWLLTMVFLPFPTALLISGNGLSRGGTVLYLGTLVAIAVSGQVMGWRIRRRPHLRMPVVADAVLRARVTQGNFSIAVLVLGVALALVHPAAGLWVLVLLVFAGGPIPTTIGSLPGRVRSLRH